jgi:hypothetical protein
MLWLGSVRLIGACVLPSISDVNEVIQKVVSQDQQQANLKQLTKENQAQIELLNKEIAGLKDRVDSVKYSGPGAKTVRFSHALFVCLCVFCVVSCRR